MSEREQARSGSELRELSARGRAMEETLGDWPEVVGESVARALRAAEKRGAAHQKELAGQWAERLGGEVQRQKSLTAQLTQEAHHLHIVLTWQQEVSAPWLLGWSRDRWQVVVVSAVIALLVSWGGVTIYDEVGPPAQARAEMAATLSNFQEWWNAATEQQRAAIQAQRVEQQEANKRSQATGKEGGGEHAARRGAGAGAGATTRETVGDDRGEGGAEPPAGAGAGTGARAGAEARAGAGAPARPGARP